jgi:hypothetical protein
MHTSDVADNVHITESRMEMIRTIEENNQLKEELCSLQLTLSRLTMDLKTEKSLRTTADLQLGHALNLLRQSVSVKLVCLCYVLNLHIDPYSFSHADRLS